jgi:hypothetical protein
MANTTDTIDLMNKNEKLIAALESIAGWRKVNIQGEYEHGLRDIIRSITDCAAAALEATPMSSAHRAPIENTGDNDD